MLMNLDGNPKAMLSPLYPSAGSSNESDPMGTFGKMLTVFDKVLKNQSQLASGAPAAPPAFQYHLAPGVHPSITNAAADRQAKAGQIAVQQYAAQQEAALAQQKLDLERQRLEKDPLDTAYKLAQIQSLQAGTADTKLSTQLKSLSGPIGIALQQSELYRANVDDKRYADIADFKARYEKARTDSAEIAAEIASALKDSNIDASTSQNLITDAVNRHTMSILPELFEAKEKQVQADIAESELSYATDKAKIPYVDEAVKRDIEYGKLRNEGAALDNVRSILSFGTSSGSPTGASGTVSRSELYDLAKKSNAEYIVQAAEQTLYNEFVADHPDAAVPDSIDAVTGNQVDKVAELVKNADYPEFKNELAMLHGAIARNELDKFEGAKGYQELIPKMLADRGMYTQAAETQRLIQESKAPSFLEPIAGMDLNATVPRGRFNGRPNHPAWDIYGKAGTSVRNIADGKVVRMGQDPKSGGWVAIRHPGGYESKYIHISPSEGMEVGATVSKGQTIGNIAGAGSIYRGNASADLLHFSLSKDGKYIDPSSLKYEKATPEPSPMDLGTAVRDTAFRGLQWLDEPVAEGPRLDPKHVAQVRFTNNRGEKIDAYHIGAYMHPAASEEDFESEQRMYNAITEGKVVIDTDGRNITRVWTVAKDGKSLQSVDYRNRELFRSILNGDVEMAPGIYASVAMQHRKDQEALEAKREARRRKAIEEGNFYVGP